MKKYIEFMCVSVAIFCTSSVIASQDGNKENLKPMLSLKIPNNHVQQSVGTLASSIACKKSLYVPKQDSSNTTTFLLHKNFDDRFDDRYDRKKLRGSTYKFLKNKHDKFFAIQSQINLLEQNYKKKLASFKDLEITSSSWPQFYELKDQIDKLEHSINKLKIQKKAIS